MAPDATDSPVNASVDALTAFIVSALEALEMSRRNATLTADLMVRTDLRGVDSHGIGMLPRYVEWTRAGFVHPWADPSVARDDLATALVDGQKGLGHPASVLAMELAITKAATYGVGIVAVRNSNHFGACANYSMMRPRDDRPRGDQLSVRGDGADLREEAHDWDQPAELRGPGRAPCPVRPRHGDHHRRGGQAHDRLPLEQADPGGLGPRRGGASHHQREGRAGLAPALPPRRQPGAGQPQGLRARGDGGHPSGVLSGGVYGDVLDRTGARGRKESNTGHCFAAIDVKRFRPLDDFTGAMDDMLQALNDTPRADGQERVYTAGEPEAETERQRRVHGIPVAPALVRQCNEIAADLGVKRLA
jgi:hypothetical protein